MRSSSACSGSDGARGPHVEAEAAEVHRPRDVREVGDHERARRRAVRRADDLGREPVGRVVGHALLEERLALGAVRVALHEHRPAAHRAHHRLRHREVVVDEIELGLAALGEEHLARAGDAHRVPVDVELDRVAVPSHVETLIFRRAPQDPARPCARDLHGAARSDRTPEPRRAHVVHRGQEDVRDVPQRPSRRRHPRVLVRGAARRAGRARGGGAGALLRARVRRAPRLDRCAPRSQPRLDRGRRDHRGRVPHRRGPEVTSSCSTRSSELRRGRC